MQETPGTPLPVQPGQQISPTPTPPATSQQPHASVAPQAPVVEAQPAPQPDPVPTQQPQAPAQQTDQSPITDSEADFSWSASEYIAHSKPGGWYAILGVGAVVLAGGIYIITQDVISVIAVVVVAVLFGIVAGRKPRVLQYSISSQGIQVGSKNYPISMFRSFSLIKEGAISSIYLTPLKRFMPAVTMYYPPENEDEVLGALELYLPEEQRQQDRVDRLMHHIRF